MMKAVVEFIKVNEDKHNYKCEQVTYIYSSYILLRWPVLIYSDTQPFYMTSSTTCI